MDVRRTLNKAATYAFASVARPRAATHGKSVGIFFFGLLGDAVMFLDAFENYRRLFQEQGRPLVFFCRPEVQKLVRDCGLGEGVLFEDIVRDRLGPDFGYLRDRVRVADGYRLETLLHVRAYKAIEDLFIHAIDCPEKVCVRGRDVEGRDKRVYRHFIENTYSETIWADDDVDQLTRYGIPLKRFGMPEYRSKVFRMRAGEPPLGLQGRGYLVVAPGASAPKKAWPADRFVEVIARILENYDCDVVLSGSEADTSAGEEIAERLRRPRRLVNLIGKTSYAQWLDLVGNARLVLTNESGTVHVAAAMGVQAVCVGAQEFGDTFLPYRPECVREDDCLPVVVRSERLTCYYCKRRERQVDEPGKRCYLRTGTFPCVEAVPVDRVVEAIQTNLGDGAVKMRGNE